MAKHSHTNDGAAAELRPKKKLKTGKHKNSSKRDTSDIADQATTLEQNSPYTQSSALSDVPLLEIERFLADNSIKITDSSAENPALRPILSFTHLPASDNNLYDPLSSFTSPTPIQSVTWPLLFAGRDVVGIAETGSGKTLAFGLPCLRSILNTGKSRRKSGQPAALIISPTRELAMQTHEQISLFAGPVGLNVSCVYGGVKKEEQRGPVRTADIVVATPGRLKDLVSDGSVDLGKVEGLVLDEADRMLDKGFEQDIKDIIRHTPESGRQTVMFTATWPPAVRDLAATFMSSPVTVTVGGDPSADPRANTRIKQVIEVVKPQEKEGRLVQFLNQSQKGTQTPGKVLVFCLYKKEAVRIENFLRFKRFKVAGIHGDLSQQERFKSLAAFKSGSVTVLVATDVAARGLDIPSVKSVINFTFPLTVEDYVHRIGR